MESLKNKYDRVLLIVAAVITIAVSALLAMKTFGFTDRFQQSNPKKGEEMGDPGVDGLKGAMDKFGLEAAWTIPGMEGQPGKRLELFRSVAIVEKAGASDIIDLYDSNSEPLRPPMDNIWIARNELDYFRSDVGSLDPDRDGFTNEQEFVWGPTDPKDPKSHPDFTRHLYLKEMISDPYILRFGGKSSATDFSIRRSTPNRRTFFEKLNQAWTDKRGGDGARFRAIKYTEKKEINPATQVERDVSELEITDALNPGKTFVLVNGVEFDIPFKYAVFGYGLPGHKNWELKVQEGHEFSLPNQPDVKYKLDSVENGLARISQLSPDGGNPKPIEVKSR